MFYQSADGLRSVKRTKMNATDSEMSRQKHCFLCDAQIQSSRNVDQLFYEDPKADSKSLATILTGVLEQTIDEATVHSKIVCRKCQLMCSQYDRLSLRVQELRQNITDNFNETANKYNLIEMSLEQNYETIHESDDGNMANMYSIESVDSAIGEVFNTENNQINVVANKGAAMKKVVLIKPENGASPFFTCISEMDETIDDDQAIHTVRNYFAGIKQFSKFSH